MLSLRAFVFVFLLVVLSGSSLAQAVPPQEIRIDLAAMDAGSERTLPISPGEYTITLVNKVPSKRYNVQATVSFFTIPALTLPGAGAELEPGTPCLQLANATGRIANAEDEDAVAAAVATVDQLLEQRTCNDQARIAAAQAAIRSTQETLSALFTVAGGQELKVVITRSEGTSQKQWIVLYQTLARGRWFSSYGFVFVPNEDELFFSKAQTATTGGGTSGTTNNQFVITRKRDSREYDFAPSVFFSWMPASREGKNLNFGATAGLGFDQSNPIVFLGPILTYNQNASLVAGVVMHKQKRLNGIYSPGQTVTENLAETQLLEETYKPNLFFGLSIRFGANPFARPTGQQSNPATSQPTGQNRTNTSQPTGNQ